jgi:hypothetical protein
VGHNTLMDLSENQAEAVTSALQEIVRTGASVIFSFPTSRRVTVLITDLPGGGTENRNSIGTKSCLDLFGKEDRP